MSINYYFQVVLVSKDYEKYKENVLKEYQRQVVFWK